MSDNQQCSFCSKERGSVLHLFVGPAGSNICDECITKASHGKSDQSAGLAGECHFCGRSAKDAEIIFSMGKGKICNTCVTTCRDHMADFLGSGDEFLSSNTLDDTSGAATELMNLVRDFARHSYKFDSTFNSGDIDWAAHNDMEQLLHPMRSKAGRLGNEEITEIVWKIEQLFTEAHFHDIEGSKKDVRKIADLVDHLLSATKRATGAG